MKKLIAIAAVIVLTSASAFAQGGVAMKNVGSGGTGGTATTVNSPVYLGTVGGTLLMGTGFSAALYAGPSGTVEGSLALVSGSVVNFGTSVLSGYFSSNPSLTISGVGVNSVAQLQVRAWDNQGGTVTSWETATIRGESASFTQLLGDPFNASTIPVLQGMNSFAIVPEPTTVLLGLIGGAGLLLRRRRQ